MDRLDAHLGQVSTTVEYRITSSRRTINASITNRRYKPDMSNLTSLLVIALRQGYHASANKRERPRGRSLETTHASLVYRFPCSESNKQGQSLRKRRHDVVNLHVFGMHARVSGSSKTANLFAINIICTRLESCSSSIHHRCS